MISWVRKESTITGISLSRILAATSYSTLLSNTSNYYLHAIFVATYIDVSQILDLAVANQALLDLGLDDSS